MPEDYDRRAVELLRRGGYQTAVTTIFGANGSATDPLQLRRVSCYAPTRAGVALQTERFFYHT
jgi:hypothetical protein